jgi:hypothetical protein
MMASGSWAVVRECGTYAAYRRHLRKRETPCQPCRDAKAAYAKDHARNDQQKARKLAIRALIDLHPDEFETLRRAAMRHIRKGR